jgi:hypothetical protein
MPSITSSDVTLNSRALEYLHETGKTRTATSVSVGGCVLLVIPQAKVVLELTALLSSVLDLWSYRYPLSLC